MTTISGSPASEAFRDGAPAPSSRFGLGTRESLTGLAFVSPWIIGFALFLFLPMIGSFVLSLTDFDPRHPEDTQFIGLANYQRMLNDPQLANALFVTLRFALLIVPTTMIVALGIAMLVNSTLLKGRNLFRSLFYMPMQIPIVASTIIWIGVLNTSTGWLNQFLATLGVTGPDWINDPTWVYPSLTLMGLWGIGTMMLIFLAGLQSVPTELYDAAKVDGAGWWNSFRHVTLPMISTVLFYNLIIALIATFQYFTQAYIIGNGRGDPANSTMFFNLYLYREGWNFFEMGYACALAWLLFVIVLAITIVLFRTARSWVYEAGGDR